MIGRLRNGNRNGSRAGATSIPHRVHLVGAGGIHMSAIGQILLQRGHSVTGSDLTLSEHTHRIEALGGTVVEGHDPANVGDAELVVATAAARSENPEILEATRRGIPVISRGEMVQRLLAGRDVLAVSGTAGKTTTASLATVMAIRGDLDPLVLMGGDIRDLGDANCRDGAGSLAIVEADEYAGAFLQYTPKIAVVTNIEPDHLDYFGTPEKVRDTFLEFSRRVVEGGTLIVCADNPWAAALGGTREAEGARVERYGIDADDIEWRATKVRANDHGGVDFLVQMNGSELGKVSLGMPGRHNVLNTLGAIAAAMRAGVDFHRAAAAAADFQGARRRFEHLGVATVEAPDGTAGAVDVIDDYAHHPSKVRALLQGARQRYPNRRLVGCFQPHTYSRSQYLLDEWRTCFETLDALYVVPTYPAREEPEAGIDAEVLAREITSPTPVYCDSFQAAVERLAHDLQPNDVCITIGAGDITEVGPMLLERLGGAS